MGCELGEMTSQQKSQEELEITIVGAELDWELNFESRGIADL